MEIIIKRFPCISNYTEGRLYVNGVYFCDTLELKDRGLNQAMSELEIKKRKVYAQTCIPSGLYKIILSMSPKFKKLLPILLYVKGFIGIRMHAGNTIKDSEGCILLGTKSSDGELKDSKKTVDALVEKLKGEKEITLAIE